MGGIFNTVNMHLYHYAGNNPVKYTDPMGMSIDDWQDNGDGTWTVLSKGATLWDIYGADWKEKSGYEGDPTKLQVGDTVGKQKTTTVEARGSGNGIFASAIVGESGGQFDKSWYSMRFTIKETGESFSAKFTTTSLEGSGLKLGIGAYTLSIEASAVFKGRPPSPTEIIESFAAGESTALVFGIWFASVSGTESGQWIINTGTYSASLSPIPVNFGFEKSRTMIRK